MWMKKEKRVPNTIYRKYEPDAQNIHLHHFHLENRKKTNIKTSVKF